ncbi:MAG: TRAP transporter small permease subunit [Betaproteobacteria bacterium]|jgi:TRAP-type mannitol/chloroaromatic compound transport system permease small subunit|nr:TRAP transporter small permease subunit [Betaproteobacteria bacterium]
MQAWLKLSRWIDALNERVGRAAYWLVLVAVLLSAGNAVVRKVLDTSSNAFLELQWYLFSAVFLLCAGYTLLRDEHVRIDVVAGRFSRRTQVWIDVFGTVFFLLPMALVFVYLSWPVFVRTWVQQEISTNAGGLLIWPARLLVPVGFALLALQAVSELVKRIGFLRGVAPDPASVLLDRSAEQELADEIRRLAEEKT